MDDTFVIPKRARLVLQHHYDCQPYYDPETNTHGGGGEMMYYDAEYEWLKEKGYLLTEYPVDENGKPCNGTIDTRISKKGISALRKANATLGDFASRLASNVEYFGSLKPIVYGEKFEIPLSYPVKFINHQVVYDG